MENGNKIKKKYLLILISIIFITIIACSVVILPKKIAEANNAKRISDLALIMNSLHKYLVNHQGQLPRNITKDKIIEISTDGANICSVLIPNYINALPIDPTVDSATDKISNCKNNYITGYELLISKDSKQIKLTAKKAELNQTISLSD